MVVFHFIKYVFFSLKTGSFSIFQYFFAFICSTFELVIFKVIIDEISMVKVEMLYQLDVRLQEITLKDSPFGGISIFAFGDLMQLRPVQGRYIFDTPVSKDYEVIHECNPRWPMFSCILLEKNHRQGEDKIYAELLNRVRVGSHTDQDMEILESRVRKKEHEDILNSELFIGGIRKECAKLNEDYIFKKMKDAGKLVKIKAYNFNSKQKEFKPYVDDRDGAIGSTQFQYLLFLRIGAKIMIIHNVDTLDGITNGQLGILIDFLYTTEGKVEKLIVKLKNKNVGKMNRERNPLIASRYPDCIVLERFSLQYGIR